MPRYRVIREVRSVVKGNVYLKAGEQVTGDKAEIALRDWAFVETDQGERFHVQSSNLAPV